LQFAGVFDQYDAVAGLRHLREQRVGERRLAVAGAARDENVAIAGDRGRQRHCLGGRHDAGGGIVVEREHGDCGFADREGRCRDDRGQQTLEPLATLRQLCRQARRTGVNLDPDMVGDQADDAFAIGRRKSLAGIGDASAQPIHPQSPIRIEHHLDDRWIVEPARDGRAERGTQHPGTSSTGFGTDRQDGHALPRQHRSRSRPASRVDQRSPKVAAINKGLAASQRGEERQGMA
jgi:hypothetical protein